MDIRSFFTKGDSSAQSPSKPKKTSKVKVIDDEDEEEEFEPEQTSGSNKRKSCEADGKVDAGKEEQEEGEEVEDHKAKEVKVTEEKSGSKRIQVAASPEKKEMVREEKKEKVSEPAAKKQKKEVENKVSSAPMFVKKAGDKKKKEVDVPYSWVAETFERIEATTKRLEIQQILMELFVKVLETDPDCLTACVYIASNQVAPAFHGVEVGVGEGLLKKAIINTTGRSATVLNKRYEEEGDLGTVAQKFKSSQSSLFGMKKKPLLLKFVFKKMNEIARTSGGNAKQKLIEKLIVDSSGSETKYLVRFLQGKLRIGLAEQTILISLAHALTVHHHDQQKRRLGEGNSMSWNITDEVKEKAVETLKQVQSELPVFEKVISASLEQTEHGEHWYDKLRSACEIQAGIPLKPMLAKPTKAISEVLDRFEGQEFTCEYKYDGERAQIHMFRDENGQVRFKIYSRNSEDNTTKYPDLIETMPKTFISDQVTSFIMDSEVVAYDVEKASLLPFQILSTRARKDVESGDIKVKVIICAFDLIYLNGKSLLTTSLKERRNLLRTHFHEIQHKFCFATSYDGSSTEEIEVFLNKAVEDHCEGLMVKLLNGPDSYYQPSRRTLNWLKLKKDYMDGLADSLDLVPIGAFYGKGKRTGVYGAYILASYNENEDEYQSITKIGTGFSDQKLKELTDSLKDKVVENRPMNYLCDIEPDVWFEPAQVWEVKAADLSISPLHKAAMGLVDPAKGIALRFPRYIRTRDDKSPSQATNGEQVADMYNAQNLTTATAHDDY